MGRNICLHIGIDSYQGYGAGYDLAGSVNDAQAWEKLMRESGAEDVTVLLDGRATHDGIREAVTALGAAVAQNDGASGLITFSGHGVATAETGSGRIGITAGICPSDVQRAGRLVSRVITVGELEAWLGGGAADTTVVLDACYTTATDDGGRPLLAQDPATGTDHVASRLILGAAPWQESYQVQAGQIWRGALSFAMITLLHQWTVHETDGTRWFNVSYGDLIFRTRQLLGVLGLDQAPLLLGASRYAIVPVLRPGSAISPGETSPTPDKVRPGSQLSHGSAGDVRAYTLQAVNDAGQNCLLGTVIVARTTGTVVVDGTPQTYLANTEYWYPNAVNTTKLFLSSGASRVTRYVLKMITGDLSWSAFSPPGSISGPGIPDAVASSYSSGSWPPSAMAGTELGAFAFTSGEACVPGLAVTVTKTSTTCTLEEVVWFSTTSGTNNDGWTGDWKKNESAVFETHEDPSTSGWCWYLKVY